METLQYAARKLIAGIPLVLGVTLVSFALMVYFGPDMTYQLLGKNPTPDQILEVRHQLGYDQGFIQRYWQFLGQIVTLDFGSASTGEPVRTLLANTVPVSLILILPGFILGHIVGLLLAIGAAYWRGRWIDKLIMALAVIGMSISFLIVIISFQILLSSTDGLNLFPVRGWNATTFGNYLSYVTVPTLATMFVAIGYETRFYRAVIVEEMSRDHVRTARAFGIPETRIFFRNILKNSLIPIITRIMFSIPQVAIGGSLLIETYFGIPGVGKATYDAIVTGDQPVLKAVVSLTAILFVLVVIVNDILYRLVDPRVTLK
ncbi:MAG: ABC transporter permease [Gammaproteobacteria bacterium PRO9]|nr:ABC transporter permease [Gammaproteobacteria bacterium PRO9]